MGSINSNTGESIIHLNDGSFFNSDGTIDFMKDIVEENKDKKIALFWDNASIHKSIKTKSFLVDNNIKSILEFPISQITTLLKTFGLKLRRNLESN